MSPDQRRQMREALSGPERSMLDIRKYAQSVGVRLTALHLTLARLQEMECPAIIHLLAPAHFIVLERLSEQQAQLIDNGMVIVLPVSELAKRFSGNALISSRRESDGPRVRVAPFCHSFGIAGIGEMVERTFEIFNTGRKDLVIQAQVKGCCGAPEVSVPEGAVPPGGRAQATVRFCIHDAGDVARTATLLSNDPDQPLVHLSVTGYATPEVSVVPDRVRMTLSKSSEMHQTLEVRGPTDMTLLNVRCIDGVFEARTGDPVDQAGLRSWAIHIVAPTALRIGTWIDTLEIATSNERRPRIIVPLKVTVESDIQVSPPTIFLGFLRPDEVAKHSLTISSRSGSTFTISMAETNASQITVGAPVQRGSEWVLPISFEGRAPQRIDGSITMRTDVPGEESITVPVLGMVMAR